MPDWIARLPSHNVHIFFIAFVLSVVLTGIMRAYAQRANLLDVPNQRSSHRLPTPRGGGFAIVVVFLSGLSWLFATDVVPLKTSLSLLVGGVLVAGIGFADDHGHISAALRFLFQLVAATFAITILGGFPEIQLADTLVDLGLAGDVMAVVFAVWLINLYNFMDGIDGIAAVEALCITGSVFVIFSIGDGGFLASLLLVLAAATLGFLVWNWPPAKIFMGDVGSGFVGFVLAVFAIISSAQSLLPIWCWLILAGVFVVDATVTLAVRIMNRENWLSAHRSHAYQRASRRFNSHAVVTVTVLAINILWLLPIAFLASAAPQNGWWLTAIAYLPLTIAALRIGAGKPD